MFNLIPWKRRNGGSEVKVRPDHGDNYYPMTQLRNEFESIWDRFRSDWERGLSHWDKGSRFGLNTGLEDKKNEYVYHADLPGFEPDEIDIKVSGNTLQLRAEHKEETNGNEGSSYLYGSFQRFFTLPQGVDDQNIDARYHSGVLEVHLPKTEAAKGKRIPVHAH